MTEHSYTKPYPHAPTAQRGPLLRIAVAGVKFLAYCWIGKAIYLFFSSNFFPYHGDLARAYLALRDGFQGIPATLEFLLDLVTSALSSLHRVLVGELGYDPINLPVVGESPLAVMPGLQEVWGFAFHSLQAGLILSLTQFLVLFCILAGGGTIGWPAPGLPIVLSARGKLLYWAVCAVAAAGLGTFAFQQGIGSGFAICALVLVCLRFPLAAALPLWFLEKVLGLHPTRILRLPRSLSDLFRRQPGQKARGSSEERFNRKQGSAGGGRSGKAGAGSRSSSGGAPEAVDAERRYRTACETFEITPGEFLQDQLRARYRELMKKVHPDLQGSARLAKLINADYEYLLNHHGWKR